MQLFGIMRGIKNEMELTKIFMQAQMFDWYVKNKQGQTMKQSVQGAYRPWEFFEYTFPESSLPEVLSMLNVKNPDGSYGTMNQAKHLALLRRMLGLEKIPNLEIDEKTIQKRFIPRRAVAMHLIGLKKDEFRLVDGTNYQEAL